MKVILVSKYSNIEFIFKILFPKMFELEAHFFKKNFYLHVVSRNSI
jgi:hypothetical protein